MGRQGGNVASEPDAPVARVAVVSADAGLSVAMSRLLLDHEFHPFGNAAHVVDAYLDYDAAVVALGTTAAGLESVSRLSIPPRRCLVIGDEVPADASDGPRVVRAPVRMDAMVGIVRELTGNAPDEPEPDAPEPTVEPEAPKAAPTAKARAKARRRPTRTPGPAPTPKVDLLPRPGDGANGHARTSDDFERELVFETEIGPPDEREPEAEPIPAPEAESVPEPEIESVPEHEVEVESVPDPEDESVPEPETEPVPEPEATFDEDAGFEIAGDGDSEPEPEAAVRTWHRNGGSRGQRSAASFAPGEEVLDEALRALGGEVAALWLRSPDDAFDVTAARGLGALERRAWLPSSHPLFQLLEEAEAVRLDPEEDIGGLLSGVRGQGGGRCVALALRDGGRLAAVVVVGGAGASDEAVEHLVEGHRDQAKATASSST